MPNMRAPSQTFTNFKLLRFLLKSDMTVRCCHLPRTAESNRKSTAAPSGTDVKNFSRNVISMRQRSDSKLHNGDKLTAVSTSICRSTYARYKSPNLRLLVDSRMFGNFIRMIYPIYSPFLEINED